MPSLAFSLSLAALLFAPGPTNALLALSGAENGAGRTLRLLPWARSWFDDLRIKPQNTFRTGLFAAGAERAGHWFPQGLVRTSQGEIVPSDDVLGPRMVAVGAGFDPASNVDAGTLGDWVAVGGATLRVDPRGNRVPGACEDLTGVMVPAALRVGRLAVLRPDRTVLHSGPAAEASRVLRESIALLGARPRDAAAVHDKLPTESA